jgi:ketosteroid isomerase-like protein
MSRENVENMRRAIDAWNWGDRDVWLAGFAPEAEWHTTGLFADEGVYRGRAGLERYWAEIHEDVKDPSLSVSDVRAIGDSVFFAATGRGQGKRSGVPFEGPFWLVTTFRDGLIVRVKSYVDPAEALEAAGLAE